MSSPERYKAILDKLTDAILLESEDRKIEFANTAFCQLFNIPVAPEQLVGLDCDVALQASKHYFAAPEEFVSRILQLETDCEPVYEENLLLADGRTFKRDFMPINVDGGPNMFMWKYNDISGKIKNIKKLDEQRQYYEKILHTLPIDIVLLNKEQRFEFVNQRAIKDEKKRAWAIGKTSIEYCATKPGFEQIAVARDAIQKKVAETKQPQSVLEKFPLPDGRTQHVYRVHHPVVKEDGELDFFIVYGVDVTEQVENKFFMDVQQKRIANMMYILNDGVFRCDDDGTINLHNDAFLTIHGITEKPEEKLNYFEMLPAEFLEKFKEQFATLGKTEKEIRGNYEIVLKNGETRNIDYIFTKAIRDEDAFLVGRLSDITAQVHREKLLLESIQKEKTLNDAKSGFLRFASHELRTPLAIITSNAELLGVLLKGLSFAGKRTDPNVILSRIIKESNFMVTITNQLLNISKIEEGKLDVQRQNIDVRSFIEEIIESYFTPSEDGRFLIYDIKLIDTVIFTDDRLFKIIVLNLLLNAFKYSQGKSSPELTVYSEGDELVIKVKDYGIGIPADEIKNIFNVFFRSSNIGGIKGTGIGLMVVEYVVKMLGGTISLESEEKLGTTFFVKLKNCL
jgi:PAS domain S-box-containing protein